LDLPLGFYFVLSTVKAWHLALDLVSRWIKNIPIKKWKPLGFDEVSSNTFKKLAY